MSRILQSLMLTVLLLLDSAPASAHKSSDSYLTLVPQGRDIEVRWDIALRDLDVAIGLDIANDGRITWGRLKQRQDAITAYALSRLVVTGDGATCVPQPAALMVDRHSDGAYAVLLFKARCPAASHTLGIDYRLLFDLDPQNRGLITIPEQGVSHTAVLGPERPYYAVALDGTGTNGFVSFVWLGAEHILGGPDHLLFLAVLLLPALAAIGTLGISRGLGQIAGLLSLFTVAHGLTITLAALHILDVPARLSEAAIALSIAVTAADNLRPFLGRRRGIIAFGFGLIHGLGFASALGPLALSGWPLAAALCGFNIGIEAVQLVLAGGGLALAALVSRRGISAIWRGAATSALAPLGSFAVLGLATYWFIDRSFLLLEMP